MINKLFTTSLKSLGIGLVVAAYAYFKAWREDKTNAD